MGQSVSFASVSDSDIARALAHVPQDGWPADDEDLVRLFGRMLSALAKAAPRAAAHSPSHTILLLQDTKPAPLR